MRLILFNKYSWKPFISVIGVKPGEVGIVNVGVKTIDVVVRIVIGMIETSVFVVVTITIIDQTNNPSCKMKIEIPVCVVITSLVICGAVMTMVEVSVSTIVDVTDDGVIVFS